MNKIILRRSTDNAEAEFYYTDNIGEISDSVIQFANGADCYVASIEYNSRPPQPKFIPCIHEYAEYETWHLSGSETSYIVQKCKHCNVKKHS